MSWFTDQARFNEILDAFRDEDEKEERENTLQKIIDLLEKSHKKIEDQSDMLRKLMAMITKMYQEGELNKDTFNKLDDFLKPYFENPYDDGNY